jgi:small subunit ribosomal protein S17|uniref:ribosomal protein S17 n=1 Tax=Eustigmatophyceae sp. WTwin 8/9 T-6m6.8 TaxID=2974615 RepID=UPI0021821244|nr:ribosomal protein S17 [Eustigmatophyceae sp. WTwin 8/9 T-6m6.8]UVI60942.1 ribosomal protein S17 [Eustigmatophyceae sp. WTwin 8/9 T-6m6.8]
MGLTEKIGIVVSTKMQKTIVVIVENKFRHPRYAKTVVKTKRYLVHDEENIAKLGDKVVMTQTRPLSKNKSWRLEKILVTSNQEVS